MVGGWGGGKNLLAVPSGIPRLMGTARGNNTAGLTTNRLPA